MLTVGLVAAGCYLLAPTGALADAVYAALGLVGVLGVLGGVTLHRPAPALPWWLMALGLALWVVGDTFYAYAEGTVHVAQDLANGGDVSYLLGYPLFAVAIAQLARARGLRTDLAATLDGMLLACGLGLICYELLLRQAEAGSLSVWHQVVIFGYPLGDLVVLVALVHLVASPGGWGTSARLLFGAVTLLIAADLANSVVELRTGDSPRGLQVLWLASYVLWGSAALHPTMTRLTAPAEHAEERFGRLRLVALVLAVLVAPATLATQAALHTRVDVWGVVIGAALMFSLVVVRMYVALNEVSRSEAARTRLQLQLAHEANHDFLTGLVNRPQGLRMVANALHRGRRSGATVALLFVDLDGFKRVNDVRGHAAGDELLQLVARRLEAQVRAGDVVARLGGDEFIVLLDPVDDPPAAMRAARRVVSDLAEPFELTHGGPVTIGASVGVAVNAGLGTDADTLLHHADLAAYRAKSSGKGRADLYDLALRKAASEQAALEGAIRQGIDNEELRAFYQPIVGVQNGRVLGYEALVRWERPGHGIVSPAEFVAVAEQSDLICDLDTWVLQRACTDVVSWNGDLDRDQVYVSVNISARHLARSRVTTDIEAALAATGLPADRLVVEVTETALADELSSVQHLHRLRELGVKIAIDDFGTGYSSLSRLQEMPADLLKIDRSFLDDNRRGWREVLRLTVGAAHAVGLRTIAEGVEHPEQLATLRRLGCDAVQGYHLARPMPAGAVPAFHRASLIG
ncbi:bifunctional diguanylate cyclase/phosphodiesterase [Nocardioides mangrovicus]|uniref:Bifunctional diguanylate cyclase/phosphodiesterase n=1 Tax=Nocardioides mangrovicus TaxID=2478913 RepID=A0A3L8NYY9_9ACTN|nr:bifunctional diguanylate cyclase/phosphodiesterase [Nocardioides mangrovicus]